METLLTTLELWNILKRIPSLDKRAKEEAEFSEYSYPYVGALQIRAVDWTDREVLSMKIKLSFHNHIASVLAVFKLTCDELETIALIYFPEKILFAWDTIASDGKIGLVCGFLDTGDIKRLVQYIPAVHNQKLLVVDDSRGVLNGGDYKAADIYDVTTINSNRVFVLQEYKNLYDISIPDLTYVGHEMIDGELLYDVEYFQDDSLNVDNDDIS